MARPRGDTGGIWAAQVDAPDQADLAEPAHVQTGVAMGGVLGGLPPEGGAMGGVLGGLAVPPPEWANTTTVMMRNIPNKYTQRMLLTEVNEAGFLGTFDFIYLPIDPETSANRGYCFLNFIAPGSAWLFKMTYEGRAMNHFNSNKVVSVNPATLQGFEANYAHYAAARVNRGDPTARPLFFRQPSQVIANTWWTAGGATSGRRAGRRGQRNATAMDHSAMNHEATVRQPQQPQQHHAWEDVGRGANASGAGTYFGLDNVGYEAHVPYPDQSDSVAATGGEARHAPPTGGHRFCPQCGGGIQPVFQFCPQCGASLEGLLAEAPSR